MCRGSWRLRERAVVAPHGDNAAPPREVTALRAAPQPAYITGGLSVLARQRPARAAHTAGHASHTSLLHNFTQFITKTFCLQWKTTISPVYYVGFLSNHSQ